MGISAYEDDLLAAIYDEDNPDGPDHDYFRALADELSAATITDLGCGTGILTVTLSGAGRRIIGIDPVAAMLSRAAARPGGTGVEWRLGMSELIDRDANDLIIMSGNVAMHILGNEWTTSLVDITRGLRPGGRLVFESRNPQARGWTAWNAPAEVRQTAVGRLRESATASQPDGNGIVTMVCSNDFIDAGHAVETTLRLQFRSHETLTRDLEAAGLQMDRVWSDWQRTPFTGTAAEQLMVIEAVKPAT
ncbi:class I SAM-dependent DNA methyltransferase [Brevibacterium atlanticum]|uniref:class I SAM-dependent DNA methyltransferase n=1 Tax=Brevibacterium atlanticum TaxID=2697563 RepID=UPI001D197FDF|nr:class I SAM-dependent methyltransferase [Brevibacterium atlanticum]